jgi:hypothetical protein
MDTCKCSAIPIIQRDLQQLGEMYAIIASFENATSDVSLATNALKSAIQGGVEVALEGVSPSVFSEAGQRASTEAKRAIGVHVEELETRLVAYRKEDERYHQQILLAIQKQEEERKTLLKQRETANQ